MYVSERVVGQWLANVLPMSNGARWHRTGATWGPSGGAKPVPLGARKWWRQTGATVSFLPLRECVRKRVVFFWGARVVGQRLANVLANVQWGPLAQTNRVPLGARKTASWAPGGAKQFETRIRKRHPSLLLSWFKSTKLFKTEAWELHAAVVSATTMAEEEKSTTSTSPIPTEDEEGGVAVAAPGARSLPHHRNIGRHSLTPGPVATAAPAPAERTSRDPSTAGPPLRATCQGVLKSGRDCCPKRAPSSNRTRRQREGDLQAKHLRTPRQREGDCRPSTAGRPPCAKRERSPKRAPSSKRTRKQREGDLQAEQRQREGDRWPSIAGPSPRVTCQAGQGDGGPSIAGRSPRAACQAGLRAERDYRTAAIAADVCQHQESGASAKCGDAGHGCCNACLVVLCCKHLMDPVSPSRCHEHNIFAPCPCQDCRKVEVISD